MSAASAETAPRPAEKLKVLFVCTHNATRSPMAQALCADRFSDVIDSVSAGVYSGDDVDPRAVATLEEIGVPLEERRARSLTDLERAGADLCAFDLIVALSRTAFEGARAAARGGGVELEYWPVEDPTQSDAVESAHRRVRDALAARIEERFGPRRNTGAR